MSKKMGRPLGKKSGYTVTPAAYHQRSVAAMKTGETSAIMQQIIGKEELTPEQTELLAQERLSLWKKMQTPAIMLMDEYIDLKTMINAKLINGKMDISHKEYTALAKLLLDISKEVNRLTQVSADKKMEVFDKGWSGDDVVDVEFDLEDDDE